MAKYRHYALAALSGLLLALAYPGWPVDFGWLVWIGLIPLLWSLTQFTYKSDRFSMRIRHGFLLGFVTGLIYFLIIFRRFWSIYPLDTLGIENHFISFFIVFLVYLISSAGMAVFWGVFGLVSSFQFLVSSKFKNKSWSLATCFLVTPATFVIFEYLRSWGFGFLWAGSGSLFGSHWTLGNLAYTLVNNHLALKLASYVGIYGVTFIVVFVNCLIFILAILARAVLVRPAHTKMPITMGIFVCVIIVAAAFGPKLIKPQVTQQESVKKINFAIIQTAQPTKLSPSPQEILANFKEQLGLLNRVAKEHPESQLIVFPEASDLFKNIALFLTPVQAQRYFSNLFKEPKLIITGGRIIDAEGRAYSRVFDLDTQNDIINYYDKRLLTPGGEFLPYPIKLITLLLSKTTAYQFDNLRELSIGTKDVSTVNFRNQFKVAPLICSELLSPGLTKQTTQNSDVIVNMASYGIFHGNTAIAKQMLAATRFRAAETAKPVITAANLGQSYVIDSQGNIAYLVADSTPQLLTGSIALDPNKTWYNKLGDLPIILASLLLMVGTHFKTLFVAKSLIFERDKEDE